MPSLQMQDGRRWLASKPVQACAAILFALAFWMGTQSSPKRSLLDSSIQNSDKDADLIQHSERLAQLIEEQRAQYGLKTGHSSAFEADPPPEFDGSSPTYFIPYSQQPLLKAPFPPLPPADDEEYMAFCLVVRNQSIDMPEFFIHHYHHHGVRRFYVYDDGTQPQLAEKPYVDSWGIPDNSIDFTYIHPERIITRETLQADMYTDCAKRSLGKHTWVAFLDPDEFLEMRGEQPLTLKEFLKGWEKDERVGALGVHWLNHNSDDHVSKQPGDARKAFKKCLANRPTEPELLRELEEDPCGVGHNRNIKTFVRPDRLEGIENIHWVKTKAGTMEVTEHGDRIDTWCHWPPTQDMWALHHYVTKSREDWELKMGRHR